MASASKKSALASPTAGVRELRQNASVLLRRVKAGEIVEITEHGKSVAKIVSTDPSHYEKYLEKKIELTITPAKNPDWKPDATKLGKPLGEKTATQILQELRESESY
jgi:prevent-host-death family protein